MQKEERKKELLPFTFLLVVIIQSHNYQNQMMEAGQRELCIPPS